jgi:hypothetical protein
MDKTKFEHYFLKKQPDGTFKVFSDKTGILKELKQSHVYNTKRANAKPYVQVGVKGCTLLHRLIASTYLGCIEGKTVNHIDGNPLNNTLENLEIVTQSENDLHAYATGLKPKGENHSRSKYSDRLLLKALEEYKNGASIKATAKKYGISQSYLNKVKNCVYRAYLMESLSSI